MDRPGRRRVVETGSVQARLRATPIAPDHLDRCETILQQLEIQTARCGSRGQSGSAAAHEAGDPDMAKKQGLYANINARRKAGTSRPKGKSTVSPKAYAAMKRGFKK